MATNGRTVLEPRQLNEADRAILDELHEGRASPSYLAEQTGIEQTYINQRLRRLDEHGHVENLARGLWELVEDPREDAEVECGANTAALRDALEDAREAYEDVDGDRLGEALDRMEEILEGDNGS